MIFQVLKICAQWLNHLFSGFLGSEQSFPFQVTSVPRLWFQPKFPSSTQKIPMETPNFNELIERLEKLEIRSQSSVISRKVALGPYDPSPIPAAPSSNIAEIRQIPEGSSEENSRPQLFPNFQLANFPSLTATTSAHLSKSLQGS